MKDFIDDFYACNLNGIILNDDSLDENDIEIDLELTEEDDKKEVGALAPVVDDEVTSKLLRQDTACIVIDDYWLLKVFIMRWKHDLIFIFMMTDKSKVNSEQIFVFILSEIPVKILRRLKVMKYLKYFVTSNRRKFWSTK